MNCPTCTEEMTRLGCQLSCFPGSWYCPRCGTLSVDGLTVTPALIGRLRKFESSVCEYDSPTMHDWKSMFIYESINTPDNRATSATLSEVTIPKQEEYP